jgi:hypothetical protein
MNKESAKEFLPLVQALADGLAIEFNDGGDWVNVVNLNTDSYDPDEYRIKPEPRTFEMWLYHPTGRMYPLVDGDGFIENDEWETITVQEVLK